jgi:hypothetical protein
VTKNYHRLVSIIVGKCRGIIVDHEGTQYIRIVWGLGCSENIKAKALVAFQGHEFLEELTQDEIIFIWVL